MDDLKLFYTMSKKLMNALKQITQMYEDHIRLQQPSEIKESPLPKFKNTPIWAQKQTDFPQFQKPYENIQTRSIFHKKSLQSANKHYSYRQRIAALRALGQKMENQEKTISEGKQSDANSSENKKYSAYFLFLREKRDSIRKQYPELNPSELSSIMSRVWKSLSEDQKKPFQKENQANRQAFDRQFRKYFDEMARIQKKKKQSTKQLQLS